MIDYSRYTTIKIEKTGRIATFTLNRPDELNTINRTMHLELEEIFEDVARDEEIHVVLLTGAGQAFSAGGDMKNQLDWVQNRAPYVDLPMARRIVHSILNVPQPVVAALNGHCIGLSANLVLFSDVIYAAEGALMGDPHVRFGLVAGDSGCVVWPMLAGMVRAKELLLTGRLITAQEAQQWGVVNYVLPKEQVLPAAMAMAEKLANGPTQAIRWTKMCLNKRLRDEVNLVLDASLSVEFAETICRNDHREGVTAFLEKRKPNFTGT